MPQTSERKKQYDRENREKRAAWLRAWRLANPGRGSDAQRKRRTTEEYKAKRCASQRGWREKNPNKVLLNKAKYLLHLQSGLPFSEVPPALAEAKAAQLRVARQVRALVRK